MYAYNHSFKQEESKKQEILEKIENTAVFLGQIGSLLQKKSFHNWIKQRPTRFTWADDACFDRLENDLSFQVRQAMDRSERPLSLIDQLSVLGRKCELLSEAFIERFELKIFKKNRQVQITKEFSMSDFVFNFLSRRNLIGYEKKMFEAFYLWNALDSIVIYCRTRETLEYDTGHQNFETLLKSLSKEYLLEGYPHDILSHDAHQIRMEPKKVTGILMRKSYCSTYLVLKDNESYLKATQPDDFRFVRL